VVALCCAVLQIAAPLALAHARLVRSSVTTDAVLRSAPATLDLWFSEQLDSAASRVVVWNRARTNEVRSIRFAGANTQEMIVGLRALSPGAHLVLWTSVSAEDGHILRGAFLFYVRERGPGPTVPGGFGSSADGPPDPATAASIIFHWVELFGAVTAFGVAAISAWVVGRSGADFLPTLLGAEERASRRLARWSLIALILSSLALLVVRGYELAGADWGSTFTSATLRGVLGGDYGELWIYRQIMAMTGLLLTVRLPRWAAGKPGSPGSLAGDPRAPLRVLAVLGAVYLYAFAASGHAASAHIGVIGPSSAHGGSLISVSILLDWLHFVADALWLGGQIAIAVAILPVLLRHPAAARTESGVMAMLDRYSPVAYSCVFLYVVTGIFSGKVHTGTWYAFFHSVYGWSLVVKMALIAAMMLVSAFTVYVLRPTIRRRFADPPSRDGGRLDRLQRWLRVNPILGAGVLLATSVMFYYPVPPGLAPAGPAAYHLVVGGLHADLRLRPNRSGPNIVTITLTNAAGQPVTKAHVTLQYTMLDMPMGTGLAPMNAARPGVFRGTADLGMGGHWSLKLLVFTPSGLSHAAVKVRVGT
jgi:copper transport protein